MERRINVVWDKKCVRLVKSRKQTSIHYVLTYIVARYQIVQLCGLVPVSATVPL